MRAEPERKQIEHFSSYLYINYAIRISDAIRADAPASAAVYLTLGLLTIEFVGVRPQACANIANCPFKGIGELFPWNGQTCLVILPVTVWTACIINTRHCGSLGRIETHSQYVHCQCDGKGKGEAEPPWKGALWRTAHFPAYLHLALVGTDMARHH